MPRCHVVYWQDTTPVAVTGGDRYAEPETRLADQAVNSGMLFELRMVLCPFASPVVPRPAARIAIRMAAIIASDAAADGSHARQGIRLVSKYVSSHIEPTTKPY